MYPCDPLQQIFSLITLLSVFKNARCIKLMQPGQKMQKAAKDPCVQVKQDIYMCKLR